MDVQTWEFLKSFEKFWLWKFLKKFLTLKIFAIFFLDFENFSKHFLLLFGIGASRSSVNIDVLVYLINWFGLILVATMCTVNRWLGWVISGIKISRVRRTSEIFVSEITNTNWSLIVWATIRFLVNYDAKCFPISNYDESLIVQLIVDRTVVQLTINC